MEIAANAWGESVSQIDEVAGEGVQIAFANLVERQSRFVYRVALAVGRCAEDAEDVAQEVFLELYRGGAWRRMEDERSYLARMAWRLAVRRRKRQPMEELPLELAAAGLSPEQEAVEVELNAWLHRRMDALPEKLRVVLALSAIEELSAVEIAKILEIPEGTVRRRMHTARERLKQELAAKQSGRKEGAR